MSNYLTKIIESKREYLKTQQLETSEMVQSRGITRLTFAERVRNKSTLGILAEFKRSSPSLGAINHAVTPSLMARQYVQGGADGISILTDELYFNGHIRDLETVAHEVEVPVLCKDFILRQAKSIGLSRRERESSFSSSEFLNRKSWLLCIITPVS